jgi:YfiH family protein
MPAVFILTRSRIIRFFWDNFYMTYWLSSTQDPTSFSHLPILYGVHGIGVPPPPGLIYGRQIHGTAVRHSDQIKSGHTETDGIWTDQTQCPIGIKTADCLPILLIREDGAKIAALHGGWRGLFSHIVTSGSVALGESLASYHGLIGPAISQTYFEVGQDVKDLLFKPESCEMLSIKDKQSCCLKNSQSQKWHIDLPKLGSLCLLSMGVLEKNLNRWTLCTFASSDKFYSFRRQKAHLGSNWTWIMKVLPPRT